MKALLPILTTLIILLLLNTSCSSSKSLPSQLGTPPYEKAFPKAFFVRKTNNDPNSTAYFYITSQSYPDSKNQLTKTLGPKWVSVEASEDAKKNLQKQFSKGGKKRTILGTSTFINPKVPNRRIVLSQTKSNKSSLSILILMELRKNP